MSRVGSVALVSLRAALACFAVAALTGALFRFQMMHGWETGLSLDHIRHAHSHFMLFGWTTPALFALLATVVAERGGEIHSRTLTRWMAALFVLAWVAHPLFLLFGYDPVALGDARIPVAVIASTANMLVWYALLTHWVRWTRRVPRDRAIRFADLALGFLAFSTLGAWGVGLLVPLGVRDPLWTQLLVHLFLDLFAEGFLVVGVLALAWASVPTPARGHWSLWPLALGLPFVFVLGVPSEEVPAGLVAFGRAGGTLVAVAVLVNVVQLWKAHVSGRWLWRLALALLAAKAVAQLLVVLLPDVGWHQQLGLRLLYLHLMLLGFVSIGLVASARARLGTEATRGWTVFACSLPLVLLSLWPLSAAWPAEWSRGWAFEAAAWVALVPPVAALAILVRGPARRRVFSPLRTPTGAYMAAQEERP